MSEAPLAAPDPKRRRRVIIIVGILVAVFLLHFPLVHLLAGDLHGSHTAPPSRGASDAGEVQQ